MSTAKTSVTVKQALLEKPHQDMVPELEQLIRQLPDQLLDFRQAETDLRQGMLKVAQRLLEKWANVADLAVPRPGCPQCGVPMRHKGRLPASMMTTLGEVAYRRPRWRCAVWRPWRCAKRPKDRDPPHDVLCCLGHRISSASSKLPSRMAAQSGSFEGAPDMLADDNGVQVAKETMRAGGDTSGQHVGKQEDE